MTRAVVRVAIADDHPLVLEGIESVLELTPNIRVVARCSDGIAAVEAVRTHTPDILVLDLNMPRMDGLGVLKELYESSSITKCILLAASIDDNQVLTSLRLGVAGILLKELAPTLLVQCIQKVHAGESWLETRSAARVLDGLLRREHDTEAGVLTPRQRQIVQFVGTGMRNKQIAQRLRVTEGTVKIHLRDIYRRLDIGSRVELALYARSRGMVPSPVDRSVSQKP
jgi:DNA-binding NarL/FixJ family response regulator